MEIKKYSDENYVNEIFQRLYPIGSIYLSMNDTNPLELFGFGEWEQIQDVFLLASGKYSSSGSVGGNENHTLTINEMPSHTHGLTDTVAWPLVDDPEREWVFIIIPHLDKNILTLNG